MRNKQTRGIRNNNPLNIRQSKEHFEGECHGSDPDFKTFECMEYGYRAAFVIMASYLKQGYNTLRAIITRWAPPSENDTAQYLKTVARYSGIQPDRVLSPSDGDSFIFIVSAMAFMENGVNGNVKQIITGFYLQNKLIIE